MTIIKFPEKKPNQRLKLSDKGSVTLGDITKDLPKSLSPSRFAWLFKVPEEKLNQED